MTLGTCTIPSDTSNITLARLKIFANNTNTSNNTSTVKITKPLIYFNDNNTYEEYKNNTYEINLGKNLFDKDNAVILNANLSNSKITSNANERVAIIKCEPNTTYTLSKVIPSSYIRNTIATTSAYPTLNMTVDNAVYSATSPKTYTTGANAQYIVWLFWSASDTTYTEQQNLDSMQVEKGSQATSYSPYKTPIELCKIGDYKDKIFKSKGKQLFNKDNINLIDSYYVDGTGTIVFGTNNKFNWVKLEPNKTYTLSQPIKSNVTVRPALFSETPSPNVTGTVLGTFTGTTPIVQTFTTTDTDIYFGWVYCNTAQLSGHTQQEMLDCIMINEGTTALQYEPYGTNGKWLLHKEIGKIVLNGTENINYRSGGRFDIEIPSNNGTYAILGLCNYYLYTNNWNAHTNTNGTFTIQNINWGANKCRMSFKNTNYSSLSDVRAGLSLNNVIIYFQITSNIGVPTTTEITDTELINQLNSVELLEGMNNISITSGDLLTPLKLTYLSEMDAIDEEYLKDVNVNFGEKFGPVNSVVLSRAAESDSIYQMDEESVEQNGLTEVKIKDNQILNGNNRDEFLSSIFNKLNGLEYYLTDFSSTGVAYYDLLDKYKINVFDNSYKTIMLNNEVDITQGLEEQIYAEKLEESETDYTKSDKTDRKINQAYIIVDKQNQQINSVVQSINTLQSVVNSQGEQVDALGTRITQTIDNITASVTSIEGQLENGVNLVKTTSVTIDDNGLNVSTDSSKISTTMTNNSFQIKDSGDNVLAFFGYDETENASKSQMDNLTVTNYFVAGNHRIEKFERNSKKRTGYFYIG